jgi:DNA-binding GntR family transcriptional regulator
MIPLRELERAIILHLLSGDPASRCSSAQLAAELGSEAETLEHALGRLARAGAICLDGSDVSPSPAVRHIDELGLIGI